MKLTRVGIDVKSVAQQDVQAMHRVRASLVEQRTSKGNQIRGLVAEYGLVAPREVSSLRRAIPIWMICSVVNRLVRMSVLVRLTDFTQLRLVWLGGSRSIPRIEKIGREEAFS